MNYTLIGTGNMAHFLARRLHVAGWVCKGIWGRNRQDAERLSVEIATSVFPSLQVIPDDSDVCIIAVSDHAIGEVCRQLQLRDTVVVHTAGSVSLDVIPHENKAALWPIYSILKNDIPLRNDIPFIYEANNDTAKKAVLSLALALSENVTSVTFEQRCWMHLIASITNNFTNHILAIGERLSQEQQVDFELFQPIIEQTFERVRTQTAFLSQTGAAKRNDEETLQQHELLLNNYPSIHAVYRAISESIKVLYSGKGK